jgi:uncharacterized protein (DUF1778 family)
MNHSHSKESISMCRRRAEDVLLGQTFFTVKANTFKKFQVLLDKPLLATDKLRRLLKTKAPWDK